jgi:predicted DNA-binding transcriptional regulator AlpA
MDKKLIPSKPVREVCGGISDMTLWRWLADDNLAFPRPIYIGKRRYWREADILAWLDAQTVKAA